MSLKAQAKAGVFWSFLEQFGTQLIGFSISIALARLLLPEDFGVIALFGVVMGIASTLVGGGLSSSLIRSENADSNDYSTVFFFNVVVSFLLYIIIYFCAPFISQFYNLPELTSIIRVYCLVLIISSFAIVQQTLLVKELNFKATFKIKLPSLIIGGVSGLSFAYFGLGVWSLVYSAIIQSFVSCVQYWHYSKWKPQFVFDKAKFKYHFDYGYKMTLSGLLDIVFVNSYTIIIAKVFSVTQLGFYNRADTLKQLPVSNLSSVLNRVTFPLFSKISNDDAKLKEMYKHIMKLVIFIIAPVLAIMVVFAEPMIRFLFTEKWLPAVPYLQILSIAGLLYPIHAYNLNILQVKGRADLFLRLEIVKKLLVIISIACAIPFGIYGLLWSEVVVSVLAFFVNTYYSGKFINYTAMRQLIDLLPSILLSAVLGLILYILYIYHFHSSPDLLVLTIGSITYFSIYFVLAYLLRYKELNYIKEIIKK